MSAAMPLDTVIFQKFFTGTHHFLFTGDLLAGIVHWSDNAVRALGLAGEQTGAEVWDRLLLPEEAAALRRELAHLGRGGCPQTQGEYAVKAAGGRIPVFFQIWSLAEYGVPTQCVGIMTNLAARTAADAVTGLRSSYEFYDRLSRLVEQGEPCGLLILGVDNFKRINGLHSHSFGDEVLRALAERLSALLPEGVALYRLDGDGFGVLLPGASPEAALTQFAHFQEVTLQPLRMGTVSVSLTFSGAASFGPRDGADADTLLRSARLALSVAKAGGGNRFLLYSEELSRKAQREHLLMENLRESVSRDFADFFLTYQPLILAESGRLYGCEVLLRWRSSAFPGEEITPYEFIPMLERSGLMLKVGAWVLRQALRQCARWVRYMPDFQMSVNATCDQFQDPEFRFQVMDCLCREGLNPGLLTLELTESSQIADAEAIGQTFDFFRSQGIKIAFDDFGTGYASLDLFRLLSADELKIDRSFLERLTYDVTDQKIITHLISLCDSMNMNVCVEGVETPEVLNIVRQLKPMLLQGYYYNKPLTAPEFEACYFSRPVPAEPEPGRRGGPAAYASPRPAAAMAAQELVDAVHAGVFQVALDEHFTFLTCSEGYRRMLGCTAREIGEKFKGRFLSFVHPDDAEHVGREIRRQMGLGNTIALEFRLIRADGAPIWVLGTGKVVKGRDGASTLVGVVLESGGARRSQPEQRRDERTCQKLLANLPVGVQCMRNDRDYTLEYISPSLLALLGYNEEEIRTRFGNKYMNLVLKEDRALFLNDIFEQEKGGTIFTLRHRAACKDGRIIWLELVSRRGPPDEEGVQRYYSGVVSVTDNAADGERSRTRSLAGRLQTAAAQWGEVIFEYDLQTGAITCSDHFAAVFGRPPSANRGEARLMVHPEDLPLMEQAEEEIRSKCPDGPLEIRLRTGDGSYRWCAVYFHEADKVGDTAYTVVGKLRDIDGERRERDRLLAQSRLDPLTGLLNKCALEERICRLLAAESGPHRGALFMVDMDNFKQINDRMGHPYGDRVLREMAGHLRAAFGPNALLGRVGGDEFMAFLPLDEPGPEWQVARVMERMFSPLRVDAASELRFSVGMSRFPEDSIYFYDLFRRADSALYRAKDQGKNRFCLSSQ